VEIGTEGLVTSSDSFTIIIFSLFLVHAHELPIIHELLTALPNMLRGIQRSSETRCTCSAGLRYGSFGCWDYDFTRLRYRGRRHCILVS